MERYIINDGCKPLKGEVCISGAKNAAVAIIPASLLVEGTCRIENIPRISDVNSLKDIITYLGAKVKFEENNDNVMIVDTSDIKSYIAACDKVKNLRASYYLLGALLGRFKKAEIMLPGGCDFGFRPMDQHFKGFEALGAKVKVEHGIVKVSADRLKGNRIYLDVVSVGATINLMLAAVKAEGVTIIENAAKEPHVVDVANFLNTMGARNWLRLLHGALWLHFQ